MEGECPANMAKTTDWAYKNLKSWRTARNQQFPEAQCPDDVFSSKWSSLWVTMQVYYRNKKTDGSEYTPCNLYLLLSGIQRYVRKVYPKMQFNLLVDHELTPLKNLCDSVFKTSLQRHWSFLENNSYFVCRQWKEIMGWDTNFMNLKTPIGLLCAVFLCNGNNFCLWVGAEQHNIITVSERSYYSRRPRS